LIAFVARAFLYLGGTIVAGRSGVSQGRRLGVQAGAVRVFGLVFLALTRCARCSGGPIRVFFFRCFCACVDRLRLTHFSDCGDTILLLCWPGWGRSASGILGARGLGGRGGVPLVWLLGSRYDRLECGGGG